MKMLLIVLAIALVLCLALVLIVAMIQPASRQSHTQSVLNVIPRTVLAWRGIEAAERPRPELPADERLAPSSTTGA